MHDEETGDEIQCPYCESTGDCKHLVAFLDRSFGEVLGGAFFHRSDEFSSDIERAFLNALQAGTASLLETADENLAGLWEIASADYKAGDTFLSTDPDLLTSLRIDLLQEADTIDIRGVQEGGPGQSSALIAFYAKNPTAIINGVFKELRARLQSLFNDDKRKKR